jgi:hypothetical protein
MRKSCLICRLQSKRLYVSLLLSQVSRVLPRPKLSAWLREHDADWGCAVGLPRVAPKAGIKLDDTFFPEGTVLSINPHVLMTSKVLWGPDADRFNPDRWLRPDAASLEKLFCPVSSRLRAKSFEVTDEVWIVGIGVGLLPRPTCRANTVFESCGKVKK